MFRDRPAPVAPGADAPPEAEPELVPLSVLALEIDTGQESWAVFLGRRGITFKPDAIGRDAITVGDAQRLMAEKRAHDLKVQALRRLQEEAWVEADRLRFAGIWKGASADLLPVGEHPASVMLAVAKDSEPKRRSVLQDSLEGEGTTYHPWPQEGEG
jgi:hypothetical protein